MRTSPATLSLLVLAGLSASVAGCKKTVGDAIRPDDHTAASATGTEMVCEGTPGRVKPLVVDWQPDERVDLEAAMQGSVVVVKYDCPTIEILPGCTVDGSYTYAGTSRKEQVIQMENMDDVHANIPVSSGSVGGQIQAGKAINLATVYVGQRSTTVNYLTSGDISGQCDGATHFIRSASLGAFSMATGSMGKAAVVAEMFGVGGGASSDSQRQALNSDGNLDSCRTSDPGSENPPAECQAPVRIELMPIVPGEAGEGAKAAVEASKKPAIVNDCLPGYVPTDDGKCVKKAADVAYTCDPKDKAECQAQCDKGSLESCFNYGYIVNNEPEKAQMPLKKACDGDIAEACSVLGEMLWYDSDDEAADYKQSVKVAHDILVKGCNGGSGLGCEIAGDILADEGAGMYDKSKAFAFYGRSCDLGRPFGCNTQGEWLIKGEGTTKNVEAGAKIWARACQGGSSDDCAELGKLINAGKEVKRDVELANTFLTRACSIDWEWCEATGEIVEQNGNFALAAQHYAKDCKQDDTSSACGLLGKLYLEGKGVDKDEAKAKQLLTAACANGEGDDRACKLLK